MISRFTWLLALLVICLCGWSPLRAATVPDLYAATVPVADQGSQALADSAAAALAQVLVKVSGSAEVLSNPVINAAMAQARSQVQQYAYSRGEQGELAARFEFAPSYITELVIEAGAPLWTANRPAVLTWVVMEDSRGRSFVSPDTTPEAATQLAWAFSQRGLPLQLPLFDLADTAALGTDKAWRLDSGALREASARYGLENILAARVAVLSDGKYTGDFSFLSPDVRLERRVTADGFAEFAAGGVSLVADHMASRFAVRAAPDGGAIAMVVSGISTYSDYAGVVGWLNKLELVERANVERVEGDVLSLIVHARTGSGQLAALIELNGRLRPVHPPAVDGRLHYQWQ